MHAPERNSIGFLRFALAALVIFSHAYPLGGFGMDSLARGPHGPDTWGGLAVAGFFVLSGSLIASSWARSPSLGRFLWHRFLRIFPGLWVCLIVTVVLLAPLEMLHEQGTLRGYWSAPNDPPFDYVWRNAALHIGQNRIDELFAKNPNPYNFDGSLWTLAYEFVCYLAVAGLGLLGLLTKRRALGRAVVLFLLVVCIVASRNPGSPAPLPFDRWLLHFGSYFLAGVAYHQWRDVIPLRADFAVAAFALTCAAAYYLVYSFVAPLTVGYLVFWLAAALPFVNFDRRGDYSYGLYIYAFPVEQLLASVGWQRHGIVVFTLSTIVLTMPLAIASYHLIERPCLRLKGLVIARRALAV